MIYVLGLGLVGGSLALALREEEDICGWDQDLETRKSAARSGIQIIPPEEVHDFNVAFVALPAESAAEACLDLLPRGPVCDTASTKENIFTEVCSRGLQENYLGGHPLGGGTLSGWRGADQERMRGVPWALAGENIQRDVFLRVTGALDRLGSPWLAVHPDEHDRALARTSHLVQILQSALAAEMCEWSPLTLRLSGPALRDTTRLASSSFDMWSDIIDQNHPNISGALFAMIEELRDAQLALDDPAGLRMLWRHAAMGREALEDTRWQEDVWREASLPWVGYWQELLRRSRNGSLFRGARAEGELMILEQSG